MTWAPLMILLRAPLMILLRAPLLLDPSLLITFNLNKTFKKKAIKLDVFIKLKHAWATYGPRAKSGPPRLLIRPANKFSRAVGLCDISIFIYIT